MTPSEKKAQVFSAIAADKFRGLLQDRSASSRAMQVAISEFASSIRDPLKARHFDAYADMWRQAEIMAGQAAEAMQAMLDRLAELNLSAADLCWSQTNDMFPAQRALYDLENNDPADYVTDVEQAVIGVINGKYMPLFRDKVLMQQIVGTYVATPRILSLYVNGTPDPGYAEPLYGRVFLKPVDKYRGIGAMAVDATEIPAAINGVHAQHASVMISEIVEQHELLRSFSTYAVNTIKIITIREPSDRSIVPIAAVLRVGTSVSSPTDNFYQGGLVFGLDMETGRIGTGVRKNDPSRRLQSHPDTGAAIAGRELTFLPAMIDQCVRLHSRVPPLDFAGWDVTVKPDGEMLLIETNPHADVDILRAHQPLLRDQRSRAFFEHHGVI